MADFGPKPLLTKIVLGIAIFFLAAAAVCLLVGVSLFIQERQKLFSFTKTSCRVSSTSYQAVENCIKGEGKLTTRLGTCYAPLWHVEVGTNGSAQETIRGSAERFFVHMQERTEQYQVGSTYPCWYSTKKPSLITWYQPAPIYGMILFIIGAVCLPIGVIALIYFFRLRTRPDL